MTLNFEIFKDDYSKSSFELFKKQYSRIIILILLISIIIASFTTGDLQNNQTDWIKTSWLFIISILILNFAYIIICYYYIQESKNLVERNPLLIGKKSIFVEENGFNYGIENTKYNWESIKTIYDLPNYIYLILHNNTSILINKNGLINAEINNFIGFVLKNISTNPKQNSKNIYRLGWLGFIPNFGLIVGGYLIFKGFKGKDNKLKLIGILNILFTPIFWFLIMQYTNKSETFINANIEFTNHSLNEVVKDLEYYKSKNGYYPDSLGELRKQNKFFNDIEMFNDSNIFKENKPATFYYKKTNDDYVLKSYGPDRKLNTKDDIFPEL